MSVERLPESLLRTATVNLPRRGLALAGVVLAHAGLLFLSQHSPSTPAAVMAPPSVVGVLVPEHSDPVTASPALDQPAPRPTPTPVPMRELPASERAPVLAPPAPVTSVAPVAAAEAEAPLAPAASADFDSSAGGPVTPPRSDAVHLNNPKPVYPAVSRRLKEEGTVVLEVFIQVDGSVGDLRVKRSSGFTRLDEAALAAVRRWKYVPARRGNDPVALWYAQSLVFSLVR